jgi:2-methylcitrate dehydratase PrpD
MLAHALDFDDTHILSKTHISTVIVPAAMAVAQARGASGPQLVAAIVAGTETTARIGLALPGAFHDRGLHPTSACGVFGATVAAGKLLGLDHAQLVAALGIAGSTAGGLFAFLDDGSGTKPFHAGWAAQAGVVSANLALRGMTGPASVLEGRFGLFQAMLGQDATTQLHAQVDDLGRRWETLAIAIKPYPACHLTHAGMDAARSLREDGLRADDIASVHVEVPATTAQLVLDPPERKSRPQTSHEARFSLPFCFASMMVDGSVGLPTYATERLDDPRILALAARFDHTIVPLEGRSGTIFTSVTVTRHDGTTVLADVAHPSGTPENPLAQSGVREKFDRNAAPVLGVQRGAVADRILHIDQASDVPRVYVASD